MNLADLNGEFAKRGLDMRDQALKMQLCAADPTTPRDIAADLEYMADELNVMAHQVFAITGGIYTARTAPGERT